ncbi:MAG: hypothetical protein QXI16_06435 [Sulfolobaceae archaeon]
MTKKLEEIKELEEILEELTEGFSDIEIEDMEIEVDEYIEWFGKNADKEMQKILNEINQEIKENKND